MVTEEVVEYEEYFNGSGIVDVKVFSAECKKLLSELSPGLYLLDTRNYRIYNQVVFDMVVNVWIGGFDTIYLRVSVAWQEGDEVHITLRVSKILQNILLAWDDQYWCTKRINPNIKFDRRGNGHRRWCV